MSVVRRLIVIAGIASVCWRFPLFHIVNQKTVNAAKVAATFNAASFAETFWTNQLLTAFDKTVNAETLLTAIQVDATATKKSFSRHVGMSDGYFYFLRGTGKIISISDDEVSLAITGSRTNVEIALQTGLVFGNAIRDGVGLLNGNDFPNSQDFNDLSAALNHLVETRVLPKLRTQAKVGEKISFVGCAEINDETTDLKPLKVISIQTKLE